MRVLTQQIQGFHDAVGFKNTRTGLNYTMEWYVPLLSSFKLEPT
jgi:hypothetical protein